MDDEAPDDPERFDPNTMMQLSVDIFSLIEARDVSRGEAFTALVNAVGLALAAIRCPGCRKIAHDKLAGMLPEMFSRVMAGITIHSEHLH